MKKFFIKLINYVEYYYNVCASKIDSYRTPPNIKDTEETIKVLCNQDISISRLGDGEFSIIFGYDIRYQKYDERLKNKLVEILHSNVPNHVVAISDVFGDMKERNEENKNYWINHLKVLRHKYYKYIDKDKMYYNTSATRVYKLLEDKTLAKKRFELWKKLWENKDIIFIEGDKTRMGIGNDLFDNAKSIKRIICPSENAFSKYDEILEFALTLSKKNIYILALGPTATVLSYDLAKNGYRALDLGHIDIEYEWFLREDSNSRIEYKYVNEIKDGDKVEDISSDDYQSQIIAIF